MPSNEQFEPPQRVLTIAKQYLRRERPVSAMLPVAVVAVVAGVFAVASLLPAVVAGGLLTIMVRAPLVRPHGTVRLRTDADIATVVESFTSPVPPILPFQWGSADTITVDDGIPRYTISYLFGFRSVELAVRSDDKAISDGSHRITLQLTMDGTPRSTYVIDVYDRDGEAEIEYEYAADQRVGLRRFPQRLIADRYFEAALRAQGYTVVERERRVII